MTQTKEPTLFQAFLPVLFLIGLLALNVYFYRGDSSYGPNQIAMLLTAGVAALVGINLGVSWKTTLDKMVSSISSAMSSIIILLLIGALAGTWLISGIVPAMITYGLDILSPNIFLFAACIICALVSLATGSSWSTVATVGVALLGIGQALGIGVGWVAGAIISGAYFGDKMSPLSDTTNLAPAIAGGELFAHIKHMAWTTGPSIIIALLVFLIAGFSFSGSSPQQNVEDLQVLIETKFHITPLLFIVPVIVIVLIVKKMPAIPALTIASILGAIAAIVFQPEIVNEVSGITDNYLLSSYKASVHSMALSTTFEAENLRINEILGISDEELLSAGGMSGMLNTVWLIMCALAFGGAMQAAGLLKRMTRAVLSLVNGVGSLIAATAGSCVFFNLTASDQYVAIVVPGKMFSEAYKDRSLAPENLSRTLEDSGTVTSVLIPWNTCGATQSTVLGVDVMTYVPYCVFNYVSPLMTVLFGFMGWKIKPAPVEGLESADSAES